MKLQKFLLAVMAVVIATATVGFYLSPSPLLHENAKIEELVIAVHNMENKDADHKHKIKITDQLERDQIAEILKKYTRRRWAHNGLGMTYYQAVEGHLDLEIKADIDGNVQFIDMTVGAKKIGGNPGSHNTVDYFPGVLGWYVICDAADLHAELTALLPS